MSHHLWIGDFCLLPMGWVHFLIKYLSFLVMGWVFWKSLIWVPALLQVWRPRAEGHFLGQGIPNFCTLCFHQSWIPGVWKICWISVPLLEIQNNSQIFGAWGRRKNYISLFFQSKRNVFISKDQYQGNCLPKPLFRTAAISKMYSN